MLGNTDDQDKDTRDQLGLLRRALIIISLIPPCVAVRSNQTFGVTIKELLHGLSEQHGLTVTTRTLHRDLGVIQEIFGEDLHCSPGSGRRPSRWCWLEHRQIALPLELLSLEQRLSLAIGKILLDRIEDPSELALHQRFWSPIAGNKNPTWEWWRNIRVTESRIPRVRPKISKDILNALFTGFLTGRRVHIAYKTTDPAFAGEPKIGDIHPLGIIVRDGGIYLVGYFPPGQPRYINLHRVAKAQILDAPIVVPAKFDLDEFIQRDLLFPRRKGTVHYFRIKFRIRKEAARAILEFPLSKDQTYQIDSEKGENYLVISATVQDTLDLRWWIFSYGSSIELLEPLELRSELASIVKEMFEIYKLDSSTF